MGHLASIKGTIPITASAGSIFLTVYHIWHRRGASTASGIRNLLKYFYWRTIHPQRDWVIEPDFDFATAQYAGPGGAYVEQFRDAIKVSEMSLWLCSRHRSYQNLGGQSWPRSNLPYGFPAGLPQPESIEL